MPLRSAGPERPKGLGRSRAFKGRDRASRRSVSEGRQVRWPREIPDRYLLLADAPGRAEPAVAPLVAPLVLMLTTPARRFVSSTGMTNLVDGDAPYLLQGLQVLKRHRRLVHAAGDLEDPAQSGSRSPGRAVLRFDAHLRLAGWTDCFSPSATVIDACFWPSASVTAARRVPARRPSGGSSPRGRREAA